MGMIDFFRNGAERRHRAMVADAEMRFQLQEYGGEIWITYLGSLVCPCSMMNGSPVEAVRQMRELYVKRHEL